MNALFSADAIGKRFGSRAVLSSASVWAVPGRITALLGRNGCGKSTLLRIGVGLTSADHGAVHYAGQTYLRPRLHQLAAAGLFYLPQDGFLTPGLTLRQHFNAVERRFGGTNGASAVEQLGLSHLLEVKTRAFSGGEVRRAEVALALARAPQCLLADEPFAGISPVTAELLGRIFRQLAELGCALVLTGHEVTELLGVADEVVWATAGTTHHIGSPEEAAKHDQFCREYLGPGRANNLSTATASKVARPRPVT